MTEFSITLTTIVIPPLFRFTNGVNVAVVCCLYSLTRVIFPRAWLTKRLTEMKLRYNLATLASSLTLTNSLFKKRWSVILVACELSVEKKH